MIKNYCCTKCHEIQTYNQYCNNCSHQDTLKETENIGIYALVEVFEDLVYDVKLFFDFTEAKDRFKKYAEIDYDKYLEDQDLIHEDYAGTKIFCKSII